MHLAQNAFLLAIPLMVCRTGEHTGEGGGRPVRAERVRADRTRTPEPKAKEQPPVVAKADPPPVKAKPPEPKPKPRFKPKPKPMPPPRLREPSPGLCAGMTPLLRNPVPMSSAERRPFSDTVQRNISEIEACYAEARRRDPDVHGCVYALLTVDKRGQLRRPAIDASNVGDPDLEDCVKESMQDMRLRAPYDDVIWVVLYPFFFEGGEIFHSSQRRRAI